MRRLALREWTRLYPKAYQKYTGYLVALTNSPEADFERGLSLDEGYGRFFSAWTALQAVTRCDSVKELVESGYISPRDLPLELPEPRAGIGLEEYASCLDRQEARALYRMLLADLRYRHGRTIEKDESGWYRVYYDGIAGYTGANLWDALANARLFGERDAAYMLAVPVKFVQPIPGVKYDLSQPQLQLGRIDYTKQAYAIKLND